MLKEYVKQIPVIGGFTQRMYRRFTGKSGMPAKFSTSDTYWEERYAAGGNSGPGSYAHLAEFKAEILNAFVVEHNIQTVIEFGCGDGNQLALAEYPSYIGIDVSQTIISQCRKRFASDPTKSFMLTTEYNHKRTDLALSLDVIFHLVEDEVFEAYMQNLFNAANRYVIVYSSNAASNTGYEETHVKHREFTKWVDANRSDWRLSKRIDNRYPFNGDNQTGSFADFYIYSQAIQE